MLNLVRPLAYFDIEGTGVDPAKDRLITLAIVKWYPGQDMTKFLCMVNPTIPIPPEATEVHGITNEAVKHLPDFTAFAEKAHEFIKDCDLVGYNHRNYDIPLLYEEFYRCGITWDLKGLNIIDASVIYKKKDPRDLTAAVKKYCGKDHSGAHDAMADVMATVGVLEGQLKAYQDLAVMTVQQLSEFSRQEERIDLAGKIVRDKNGDAVYNIGKAKGVRIADDPSFAHWMLRNDFTEQTKQVLRELLDDIYSGDQKEML